jgi:hypothetical protein
MVAFSGVGDGGIGVGGTGVGGTAVGWTGGGVAVGGWTGVAVPRGGCALGVAAGGRAGVCVKVGRRVLVGIGVTCCERPPGAQAAKARPMITSTDQANAQKRYFMWFLLGLI